MYAPLSLAGRAFQIDGHVPADNRIHVKSPDQAVKPAPPLAFPNLETKAAARRLLFEPLHRLTPFRTRDEIRLPGGGPGKAATFAGAG